MESENPIQQPPAGIRIGWEQAFQRMHAEADDKLLIPDVFEDETFEVW